MTDESLRWVIANGQIDRAKEIIKNACRWNNKNYKEVMEKIGWGDLIDTDSKALTNTEHLESKNIQNRWEEKEVFIPLNSGPDFQTVEQKNGKVGNDGTEFDSSNQQNANLKASNGGKVEKLMQMKVERYTVFDIFRNKRILIVSMIMWYTWICDSFVYFGLYMTSSNLYGDRYINFFLAALVEYPACFLEYLLLARIGRKWTAVIGHLIATLGLSVATALTYTAGSNSSMLAAATAFVLIGKMGITVGYSSIYLTTPELYPTNMRNIGLGVCSFMETIGSMIAPFSRNVSSKIQWLPPCVFAVMCLITVLLFAFVPETNGVELPQTIEELTEWYRVNKFELKIGKNKRAATTREEKIQTRIKSSEH